MSSNPKSENFQSIADLKFIHSFKKLVTIIFSTSYDQKRLPYCIHKDNETIAINIINNKHNLKNCLM